MPTSAVVAEAGAETPAFRQWVVFVCDGERYGFPLERVVEIMTPRPFTRLPGAGPEVCGLVGMRGRVVTVLDLGVVLGTRGAGPLPDHRLLLLDLDSRRVAAAVDDVVAVTTAVPTALAPAQAGRFEGEIGSARLEDGAFTALEPAALMRHLLP